VRGGASFVEASAIGQLDVDAGTQRSLGQMARLRHRFDGVTVRGMLMAVCLPFNRHTVRSCVPGHVDQLNVVDVGALGRKRNCDLPGPQSALARLQAFIVPTTMHAIVTVYRAR
jgi:hypothetical protein